MYYFMNKNYSPEKEYSSSMSICFYNYFFLSLSLSLRCGSTLDSPLHLSLLSVVEKR